MKNLSIIDENEDLVTKKYVDDHVYPNATITTSGFMSAADKTKLDALEGSGGTSLTLGHYKINFNSVSDKLEFLYIGG